MTETTTSSPLLVDRDDACMRIRLNRPGRGNALTPELLDALVDALSTCDETRVVVLTGEGRAFSSGGDISEFHARAEDPQTLQAYGDRVVSALNQVILALRDLPCPSVAAVNGPVTGGAIGLMLACDTIVMNRDAFIQPYYARMGFAPDGGWTALMPDRIGSARTGSWLTLDNRVSAVAAFEMGLADRLADTESFETVLTDTVAELAGHDPCVATISRRLLDARRSGDPLSARLERERTAFCALLVRPETRARMAAFLAPRAEAR
ncbi:enoyl-CoA hydratase/isomerase family protein [Maricaulis sp.]|uniref:enoyl-CoA hydratase/isomerase family protein n=1 Tax=Maricaulis sp. TaxID=1486257 RepID=UPI0025C4D2A7|nr:enoyl-CoA hydratase/isomerase family protein [Maricaulis sp.]